MSRIATLFAFAMALIASRTAVAQQPTEGAPCSYELCAVRYTAGFSGEHLLRGQSSERALKIDFTGDNAVDFLSRVESAAAPARSFKTRRIRSAVFAFISAAAIVYYSTSVIRKAEGGGTDDPTMGDWAAFAIGLGAATVGGIEASRSNSDLSRAIWEFNRAPVR